MEKDQTQLQKTQKKGFITFQPLSTPQQKGKETHNNASLASPCDSIFQPHLIKPVDQNQDLKFNQVQEKEKGIPRNPFMRFHNDSNSKALFSESSSKNKDNLKSVFISQPIKDESSGSLIQTNEWLRENYFKNNSLVLRHPISGSRLYFFRQQQRLVFSKLLWFKPNNKNGRNMLYDIFKHKCLPFFKCGGCFREFQVPSALGGHLSSCQRKNQHISSINQKLSQKQPALFSLQQHKLRSANRKLPNLFKQRQDCNDAISKNEEVVFQSSESKQKVSDQAFPVRKGRSKPKQFKRFKRVVIKKGCVSARILRIKMVKKKK